MLVHDEQAFARSRKTGEADAATTTSTTTSQRKAFFMRSSEFKM
jgi:hypothetical protein